MWRTLAGTILAVLWVGNVSAQPPLLVALEDCRQLSAEEQRETRYLWKPGGYTEEERNVIAVQVNRLSRSAYLKRPRQVAPDLIAVCLDHYVWPNSVWEKQADFEPYLTLQTEVLIEVITQVWYEAQWWEGKWYPANYYPVKKKENRKRNLPNLKVIDPSRYEELQQRTASTVPIVRGDWWIVNASRQLDLRNRETGFGYYDWLGVKDRDTFLSLARFKQVDADALGRRIRAALDKSRVAQHGRQIDGWDSLTGKVFMTLDTKELRKENLPTELLKPGTYKHDAEEWYLQAPNGLWYYGLFGSDGKRQETAPDYIGPDDSPLRTGRDGRIHVGISCIRCHVEDGLRPIDDWARRTFRGAVRNNIANRTDYLEFERLYLSDLNKQLEKGRQIYREALAELVNEKWTGQVDSAAISRMVDRYAEDPVAVDKLAVELGMEAKDCGVRLRKASLGGEFPISLAPLLDGGSVRRETIEDFWPVITLRLLGEK